MAQAITELLEDKQHKIRSLEDMNDKANREGERAFTDSEKEEMDGLVRDVQQLDEDIKHRREHEKRQETITGLVEDLKKPIARLVEPMAIGSEPKGGDYPQHFKRAAKMKAFPAGMEGEREAYRCGMSLRANVLNDHKAKRWCERHNMEVRAMSEAVPAAGGVLVHDEMSQRIIDLTEEYGTFRKYAYVEPMASDVKDIARQTGGLTAAFAGEGATAAETTSAWDNVKLVAKKLGVQTRMSIELEEDAVISLADRFAVDTARAFALKEDQTGFNGDGTATYGGCTGITVGLVDGTHAASWIEAVATHDLFSEISDTDIQYMMGALPEYAHAGDAAWYCSRACWAAVFNRLALAAGGTTMTEHAGKMLHSFMGYPIRIVQVLPTDLATLDTDVMFLFGDLYQACTMGVRRGITIARSEHVHWSTDQVALKAIERVDFVAHDMGDATTPGPIVGMIGNAA